MCTFQNYSSISEDNKPRVHDIPRSCDVRLSSNMTANKTNARVLCVWGASHCANSHGGARYLPIEVCGARSSELMRFNRTLIPTWRTVLCSELPGGLFDPAPRMRTVSRARGVALSQVVSQASTVCDHRCRNSANTGKQIQPLLYCGLALNNLDRSGRGEHGSTPGRANSPIHGLHST